MSPVSSGAMVIATRHSADPTRGPERAGWRSKHWALGYRREWRVAISLELIPQNIVPVKGRSVPRVI